MDASHRYSIVEIMLKDKQYLNLIEPGGTGKCLNECATIAKSCQNMIHEDVDVDELSAFIWKNKLPVDEVQVTLHAYYIIFIKFRLKYVQN